MKLPKNEHIEIEKKTNYKAIFKRIHIPVHY